MIWSVWFVYSYISVSADSSTDVETAENSVWYSNKTSICCILVNWLMFPWSLNALQFYVSVILHWRTSWEVKIPAHTFYFESKFLVLTSLTSRLVWAFGPCFYSSCPDNTDGHMPILLWYKYSTSRLFEIDLVLMIKTDVLFNYRLLDAHSLMLNIILFS